MKITDFEKYADLYEEQIIFYRNHLDIFIEDVAAPIKLTRAQHVVVREIGNETDIKAVKSRGFGKTWEVALAAWGLCVLYPGTNVIVVSSTGKQATLVLAKLKSIAMQNPNVANELYAGSARNLIQLNGDSSKCTFKNGSTIQSSSIESARGLRGKIVIVDEALDVDQSSLEAVVNPIRNATREIAINYGFKDYASKTVTITSACEKSNPFYDSFFNTAKEMSKGTPGYFACALDYRAAAANGITDMDFFIQEKERMPSLVFDMEYGSLFVGATTNSAFPYELTQTCRTLNYVEVEQPKNSKSRYVLSLDIATSEASGADNSIISILKFSERSDGTFARKLVYMRSFHGKSLDVLAEEIRKLFHVAFPNIEKIVYDARGLGDSLDRFFDKEWVDVATGKEYPPLVTDETPVHSSASIPALHPFRAIQTLNQRIYTNLRVALEKRTIELPVQSRTINAKENGEKLTLQQRAIFLETDALQYEMGNIIARIGASGNVLYDTPRASLHKDRYSSLAMGNDYISELEKDSLKKYRKDKPVIGFAGDF